MRGFRRSVTLPTPSAPRNESMVSRYQPGYLYPVQALHFGIEDSTSPTAPRRLSYKLVQSYNVAPLRIQQCIHFPESTRFKHIAVNCRPTWTCTVCHKKKKRERREMQSKMHNLNNGTRFCEKRAPAEMETRAFHHWSLLRHSDYRVAALLHT